jgi:hypothetical protein
MSFDLAELLRIRDANSGFFGKWTRISIANSLHDLKPSIDALPSLPKDEHGDAIRALISQAIKNRKSTFHFGDRSYRNSKWAAAKACECWLQNLALGSEQSKVDVDVIISEMMRATAR